MKWSVWLRWLLVLPASLVAMTIVYTVVSFMNMLQIGFMGPAQQAFMALIMASGASAYAFVWAGVKCAPGQRRVVAIVLAVAYGFIAAFVLSAKVFMDVYTVSWAEALCVAVPGSVGAIAACLSFCVSTRQSE